jgi:signal transduction histidine kinase
MSDRFQETWVVGLWCHDPDETVHVMLVPADDLLERLRSPAESLRVAVAVNDGDGSDVWGGLLPQSIIVARHLSDLALPWQLRVASANPAETGTILARRRTFAVTGLGLMVIIVAAAGFFVFRAVHRELEIARLQADFISTVSHEFRTPLTAMNHLTDMLQENAVAPERLPQYYGALQRETSRLQRVVEGLLDFRRFEAGRRAYRMELMDPQEVVRQVLESFAGRHGSHRLHASLDARCATVSGDREAIAVAVSNLVDNALKYSPADAPISVEVEAGEGMVKISVQDHGPGIRRDERRRVFRRFVRGTAARDGNVKGTGIGLAIVQAVMKAHGGRVHLQTVPGQGSRFTLLLPRV